MAKKDTTRGVRWLEEPYIYDPDEIDIVEKFIPRIESRQIRFGVDGKFGIGVMLDHNIPWVFIRQAQTKNCYLWSTIFHEVFRLVPSRCLDCYKVVVRPRNLREHMRLLFLMKELDRPSKLGIETRDSVPALYGAYFYNDSLEAGKECYRVVRRAVDENISPDVGVILKRGCTEIEHAAGPSSQWDRMVTKAQMDLEAKIEKHVVCPPNPPLPEILERHILNQWIKWAYAHGDHTYKEFTKDNQPLYPAYETYHGKKEQKKKSGVRRGSPSRR